MYIYVYIYMYIYIYVCVCSRRGSDLQGYVFFPNPAHPRTTGIVTLVRNSFPLTGNIGLNFT